MSRVRVLIATGDGLNCERETAYAFRLGGGEPELVHITDLLEGRKRIEDYQIMALIGGFSNGDHLGAGTVQACRFRHRLREEMDRFIEDGKPVIGICNGFQTLVKMGILPEGGGEWKRTATITTNDSGKYEDRWVYLLINPKSPCIWTRGLESLYLPVRHGEGKFYTGDPGLIPRLFEKGQVVARYSDSLCREPVMTYPLNPNGSLAAIAGLCDPGGTVFGFMPHPEAYLSPYNHPTWYREAELPPVGLGAALFRNAVDYVRCSRGGRR